MIIFLYRTTSSLYHPYTEHNLVLKFKHSHKSVSPSDVKTL